MKLLGRWHNADFSGGFELVETNDPAALYAGAAKWADLLEFSTVPVIEDGDAGPVLANRFKKINSHCKHGPRFATLSQTLEQSEFSVAYAHSSCAMIR